MCVCFGSISLTFFLLRDYFKSLKCCLDLWLSSMFDCIHVCVFLFFEKLFLSNLNSYWTPLDSCDIYRALSTSFYRILDSFLIHRETFWMLDSFSIHQDPLSCIIFSHVLHLSFILSFIASLFITFMHLYGFLMPPWSSLIIFIFIGWSFLTSCTLCQSWQKGGEIVEKMWFLFKILHVKGRNTCFRKREMCFILLGGVFTSFLYTDLVTLFTYIVIIFDIYMWEPIDPICSNCIGKGWAQYLVSYVQTA